MCTGSCKRWYFGADVAPHTVYTVKPQTLAEPENKQFRVSGTAAICFPVTSERRGFFFYFSWLDRSSHGEWKWTKRGSRRSMSCRRSSGAEQVQTGGLRTDRKHWVRGRRTRVDGAQMLRDKQEGADLVVVLVKAFTHNTKTHTHTHKCMHTAGKSAQGQPC